MYLTPRSIREPALGHLIGRVVQCFFGITPDPSPRNGTYMKDVMATGLSLSRVQKAIKKMMGGMDVQEFYADLGKRMDAHERSIDRMVSVNGAAMVLALEWLFAELTGDEVCETVKGQVFWDGSAGTQDGTFGKSSFLVVNVKGAARGEHSAYLYFSSELLAWVEELTKEMPDISECISTTPYEDFKLVREQWRRYFGLKPSMSQQDFEDLHDYYDMNEGYEGA